MKFFRRNKTILVWGTIAVLFVCSWLARVSDGPSYNGYTAQEYLDYVEAYNLDTDSSRFAVAGFKGLGTNAIPFLIKQLELDSKWAKTFRAVLRKLPVLSHYVSDNDWRRVRAVVILGELGPEARSAIPALKALLPDKPYYSWRVEVALLRIEGTSLEALIPMLADTTLTNWTTIASAVVHFKEEAQDAIPPLIAALDHTNLAAYAAQTLGELALEPAFVVPILASRLTPTNNPMTMMLLHGMIGFGTNAASWRWSIEPYLQHPDQHVRNRALWACKSITPTNDWPALTPILLPILNDSYEYNRTTVIWHLASLKDRSYLPRLREMANDPSPRVREAAASAIDQIEHPVKEAETEILPLIILAAGLFFVVYKLIAMVEPHYGLTSASEWLRSVDPFLQSDAHPKHFKAVHAFRKMGPRAVPFLVKALNRGPGLDRYLDALVWRFTRDRRFGPLATRRAKAARILGLMGAQAHEAIPALTALAKAPTWEGSVARTALLLIPKPVPEAPSLLARWFSWLRLRRNA